MPTLPQSPPHYHTFSTLAQRQTRLRFKLAAGARHSIMRVSCRHETPRECFRAARMVAAVAPFTMPGLGFPELRFSSLQP